MASCDLILSNPPRDKQSLELWLQHAAGRIIFEDIRSYAIEKIDPTISGKARSAAMKSIDDAVYGLMMVIDGVSGGLCNSRQSVGISVTVRLKTNKTDAIAAELDLCEGDGMCMGYHGWISGDYGEDPIATLKSSV